MDGAVLLSQSRNSAPRLPTSSKLRPSHEVQCKDHRGSSPQRGLRVVKHRQSSRQKRGRHKEKGNGKKGRRVETETDKARKEESTVIVEGCVLNSDSQLNETFTVSPELHRALPQEHADTERGTQEGSVAAGEDTHGPSRRMVFEQAKEPTEAQTSPRRAVQTAVSPLSLQRTNKSAVFGPPISFKGDGSDVPEQGRQQGHGDRQQDRRDEVLHCSAQLADRMSFGINCVVCSEGQHPLLPSAEECATACRSCALSKQSGTWSARCTEGVCHALCGCFRFLAGGGCPPATCSEGDSRRCAEPPPPASSAASFSEHLERGEPPF